MSIFLMWKILEQGHCNSRQLKVLAVAPRDKNLALDGSCLIVVKEGHFDLVKSNCILLYCIKYVGCMLHNCFFFFFFSLRQ